MSTQERVWDRKMVIRGGGFKGQINEDRDEVEKVDVDVDVEAEVGKKTKKDLLMMRSDKRGTISDTWMILGFGRELLG
jgi:hypothetical protein